ncbi:MAG: RidA family protein [Proteobacteria bacterium]|nr:RidA family protein [Pseudomonadota bacterium]
MAKRQVLTVPGIPHHQNPIPQGVKIGNMVFSSAISGADAETGELPEDAETQAWNTFRNIRLLVEAAGGTTGDIAKMSVSIRDDETRKFVNDAWLDMFPDEDDRPARHTQAVNINPRYHVQIEFTAVLDGA